MPLVRHTRIAAVWHTAGGGQGDNAASISHRKAVLNDRRGDTASDINAEMTGLKDQSRHKRSHRPTAALCGILATVLSGTTPETGTKPRAGNVVDDR